MLRTIVNTYKDRTSFNKKKKCNQRDAAGRLNKCLLNEFEKALASCQGFFLYRVLQIKPAAVGRKSGSSAAKFILRVQNCPYNSNSFY
jgi:hypothetical protein